MKLYRCELCGRVFNKKTSHKCYGGCFRKHRLIFTEFEDVDNEYIKRVISDVKEINFPNIPLEPKIEYLINWKQARVDAAISAMNGLLSRRNNLPFDALEKEISEEAARLSVALADALIAELKKTNETK